MLSANEIAQLRALLARVQDRGEGPAGIRPREWKQLLALADVPPAAVCVDCDQPLPRFTPTGRPSKRQRCATCTTARRRDGMTAAERRREWKHHQRAYRARQK